MQGWLYVAFVIDVFARRIVGWRVSSSMHTYFVLDAQELALYARQPERDRSLVYHSDRGSPYVSIRYSERLAEAAIEPSVGSRGDSDDNTLAETIKGLSRVELIHRHSPTHSVLARIEASRPMIPKPESSRAQRSEGLVSIGLTSPKAKRVQALVPAASPWE